MSKVYRPLVYVAFFGDEFFKIGITANFHRRLKEIKRGMPMDCTGCYTLRVEKYSDARKIEAAAHKFFSGNVCKNSKEWFTDSKTKSLASKFILLFDLTASLYDINWKHVRVT